jgi:hypothetical protein
LAELLADRALGAQSEAAEDLGEADRLSRQAVRWSPRHLRSSCLETRAFALWARALPDGDRRLLDRSLRTSRAALAAARGQAAQVQARIAQDWALTAEFVAEPALCAPPYAALMSLLPRAVQLQTGDFRQPRPGVVEDPDIASSRSAM